MRILHIITQLELGGAQKNALDIVSYFASRPPQYQVHLISSRGILSEDARRIPHARVHFSPFLKRSVNPFFDLLAFLHLFFYIKRHRIQIVHTHSSKAGILGRWAAKLAGVGVIVHTIHGWGFHDYVTGVWNDLYISLEKITAPITTKFIAVTDSDIRSGLMHGIGCADQYALIRYGLDFSSLSATPEAVEELRRSLGITDEKVVGMVACLKPQKNPLDFIKVAALVHRENSGVRFILVGDGLLRPRVKREIERLSLAGCVCLLGWRRDISRVMSLFDVCVLTSLWEGLPFVFLEAMSLGKPVVAYDICGAGEIVKDSVSGFLVRPQDTEGLAKKVELLLENPQIRDRMKKFSRLIASQDEFSLCGMCQRIEQLYEHLFLSRGNQNNGEEGTPTTERP